MNNKKDPKDNFSVALGLFDYINPACYSVTSICLLINMYNKMNTTLYVFYILGVITSLIFGFTIPTVKLLVGLGKFEFKMPVNLVFYVNSGILLSSISVFCHINKFNLFVYFTILVLSIIALFFIYRKVKKFNTIAVLTGFIGYLLMYIALISLAVNLDLVRCIVLYGVAVCFFVFLVILGITANLKDARVHWVIETCNVLCQFFVALSTVLLFI